MLDVNVKGTYHLFEAARILKIPRVIFISSLTVATGNRERTDCATERHPRPSNLYACTKFFGESLAEVYHRQHGIQTYSLRLGQPVPNMAGA